MAAAHDALTIAAVPGLRPEGRASRLRAVLVAAMALALSTFLLVAVRVAHADDEGGYLTVSGVAAVDEAEAFSTLTEALNAVDEALGQEGQGAQSYTVGVHGTVAVSADEAEGGVLQLPCPGPGVTAGIVGADESATLVLPESSDSAPVVTFAVGNGCSVVVRSLAFENAVGISAEGGVAVDASTFTGPLACTSAGQVSVAGSAFAATGSVSGLVPAVSVQLSAAEAGLSFTGNTVKGFAEGVSVAASQGSLPGSVRVSSNTFSLSGTDLASGSAYALELAGGAWPGASVVYDGNTVTGASAHVLLDASFVAAVPSEGGDVLQGVADGTLTSGAVTGLFELMGVGGTSVSPLAVDASYAGTPVAEQVAQAAATYVPAIVEAPASAEPASDAGQAEAQADQPAASEVQAAPAEATAQATQEPTQQGTETFVVSYDANGATAGTVPDLSTVQSGTQVEVEPAGSIVRSGYVFEGWNTAADGSGIFYAVGQVFAPVSDMTLYAQWTPTGTVATVTVAATAEASAGGQGA